MIADKMAEIEKHIPTMTYAGFRYQMVMGLKGQAVMAVPMPGQHPAAAKGRHCRAAVEEFNKGHRDV